MRKSKSKPGIIVHMHTTKLVRGRLVSKTVGTGGQEKFARSPAFRIVQKVSEEIPREVIDERDLLEKL